MAFSFGQQTQTGTATPAFGFGTTTTTAPSFGFGGTAAASSTPSFGFGSTTTTTSTTTLPTFGFGTSTTSAPSFGFGTTTTTSSAPSAFSGFGTTTSQASTGFGLGASTGFGTAGQSSGFGFPSATGSAFQSGGTGFGFGSGLGGGSGTSTTFGGFGAATNQQQQQQQAQQQQQQSLENLATAITLPQIYGDERDAIIAKWNQLQAYWGTGKGYYSMNGCHAFAPDNPYCKFKTVGYSYLPSAKNEDGLVGIVIKKKEEDVIAGQQAIVDALFKIIGGRPQYSVCVEGIKLLPDDKTELVIYILERPDRGPARRLPASETHINLSQPNIQKQLETQILAESITPKIGLSKDHLKQYLDNPPSGIHPLLWQQAKLDNPDPENLIPVPMIGFKALFQRMKFQEQQSKAHQQRLDLIAGDLTQLQHKQGDMMAKLEEYKRKHLELGHRLLQVVVKQEIFRKMGYAIQAEEEQLRVQLEKTQAELNHPTQFKGRLNEIMSQIRMQNHLAATRADVSYQMDPALQEEVKQLLKQQQEGLRHLINIIKEDTHDLQLIEQNLEDVSQNRR